MKLKMFLLFILVLAFGLYLVVNSTYAEPFAWRRRFEFSFVLTEVEITYSGHAQFYAFDSGNFYFLTNSGMHYMNSQGEIVWDYPLNLSEPMLVGNFEHVAVADVRGNVLYVFGPSGRLHMNQFANPILHFSVNREGYASVLKRGRDYYEISVINNRGTIFPNWRYQDQNLFPMSTSISNDGRFTAASNLSIQRVNKMSNIMFMFNRLDEGRGVAEHLFASQPRESQIAALLHFMDRNRLLVFSDTAIANFNVRDNIEYSEIILTNRIEHVGFMGDRYFVVALGAPLVNRDAQPIGRLEFYDATSSLVGSYNFGQNITYLSAGPNGVIVGAGHRFAAFSPRGELLWEYIANQDVNQLIFLENTNTVLMATNTGAVILNRQRVG